MVKIEDNSIVDIIDVEPRHLKEIKSILARNLPYKKVWAYGSRVKWNANERSDLDLVAFDITDFQLSNIKDIFDESSVPFIVQILKWESIPDDFKENIKQKYFVLQKEDDWGEFRLGDVGEIVTGNTPSKNHPEDWGDEMPFITPSDYSNYKKKAFSSIRKLSANGINRLKNKILPKDSIMVTCIGSDMAKVAMSTQSVITNQQINSIIPNKNIVNKNFLYYQLVNLHDTLRSYGMDGTAVPILNKTDFSGISVSFPLLPEQKAIADILSSLDDKIDLLNRQNKTLENLAETLFRHYFIEEAEDSWEEKPLSDLVKVIDNRGKTPPNQSGKTPYPVIEVNGLGDRLVNYSVVRKYVDEETFKNWFRNSPKKYDTLISTVGSIGSTSMFVITRGNIAQNVIALQAIQLSPFYLYQILKYKKKKILSLDIGGVQPSIKVPHLLEIYIPIPPKEKIQFFDIQITHFVNKMEKNYLQIQTLEKLRDTLLPKLMNGEVQIKYDKNSIN